MSVTGMREKPPAPPPDEMRDFLFVVWRALRMITAYLERKYGF